VVKKTQLLKTSELFTLKIAVHLRYVEANSQLGCTCVSCSNLGEFIHPDEESHVHSGGGADI
jgi:hypothetical protein